MDTKETMRTTFAAREFTNDPVPDDVPRIIWVDVYRIDNPYFSVQAWC